ncbi:hypothetical protein [Pseudoclavibacter helvolus]|uniref:Uncharacterized protein n=1 Tax=Pseudoclavibacter helvolus TaxID=255205 RepID=A0A7W4ULU8_9MICO|nr:hypothetical protein [Pseudoclavibacter helvolus]MBB2956768.1 hypothetical protein [Pseudoclavibacter helvolus]
MPRLNAAARTTLRNAGLGPTAWSKLHGGTTATDWRGDACGCPDDRCAGHHHDTTETCGCLEVLIRHALPVST